MTYLHPFPPPARKDVLLSVDGRIVNPWQYMGLHYVLDDGSTQQDSKPSAVESPGTCAQMTAQADRYYQEKMLERMMRPYTPMYTIARN